MKLFDIFEAVKFSEENMIFITHGGYLYYIYNSDDSMTLILKDIEDTVDALSSGRETE